MKSVGEETCEKILAAYKEMTRELVRYIADYISEEMDRYYEEDRKYSTSMCVSFPSSFEIKEWCLNALDAFLGGAR